MSTLHTVGWIKDPEDKRDFKFNFSAAPSNFSPVDLRSQDTPIFNQGNLGSCTACATTAMVRFVRKKQFAAKAGFLDWKPSVLFTYYNTRLLEGTVNRDNGAQLRNSLKSVNKYGAVNETKWPYIVSKFKTKPTSSLYTEGLKQQTMVYYSLATQTVTELKQCLSQGYPFVFGSLLYTPFQSTTVRNTGIVPMPNPRSERMIGGHAMMCVGWTTYNGQEYFIVRNSWGNTWGLQGYCLIPVAYLTSRALSADFWTIRQQES